MNPTNAQIEALAQVLYEAAWHEHPHGHFPWNELTDLGKSSWRHLAHAALSSSVIGDLIADGWDKGAAAPRMQDGSEEPAVENPYRAAALSPTPADGTTGLGAESMRAMSSRADGNTSERSET